MNAIDLNKKQKNVYEVIQRNPGAADDDALLIERYWVEIDGWDESKSLYWNLSKVTRPGTITRRRRELHEAGLITYSKDTNEVRERAMQNERERAESVAKQPGKAVSWLDD